MTENLDAFLEHHGIKGMRWGVRNDDGSINKKKAAAVVLGSAAAVGAIAVGAIFLKKHLDVKAKDIPDASNLTKLWIDSQVKEPVHIVHSSRGLNRGYAFLRDGGLNDPEKEFIKAGLDKADIGFFKRFDNGTVAARFADPLGRIDASGRPIGHDVLVPKSMARTAHDATSLGESVWPKIKDIFNAFYESDKKTLGPGF